MKMEKTHFQKMNRQAFVIHRIRMALGHLSYEVWHIHGNRNTAFSKCCRGLSAQNCMHFLKGGVKVALSMYMR
jgi:hypothetical protein